MISLFKKSSDSRIGLDISAEGISIVFLKKKNNVISLENYVRQDFSKEMIQNGQVEDPKAVAELLKSMINEYKFGTRETVISIPSNLVFIKKMTLPDLPESELRAIAPQEASKHLPQTIRELNVDFQILEQTRRQDESGNKVDIVLCALSKGIARSFLEITSEAGLVVNSIDVSSFAMIGALAGSELINDPEKTYISVLIDYENTDINIIQNGMPVFTHSVPMGKKNVIENVVNALSKKREDTIKILPGVALVIPGEDISEDPDINKASSTARNIYSNIASEIQKTIEFYNSERNEPVQIDNIYLGGCGVCIQKIDKYIFNKLKIDTNIYNPFTTEKLQEQENLISPVNIPSFSISMGLAFKELSN